MTRSLIIAPQWIGDAVMSEPLFSAASGRAVSSAAVIAGGLEEEGDQAGDEADDRGGPKLDVA